MTGHSVHYKILFFIIILAAGLNGQRHPDSKIDSLLSEGIKFILSQQYDAAKIKFTELNNNFPENPLGKIYLAANEIARAYDTGEEYNNGFININLIEAKEISEELIDADDENKWNYYYLALAEGYNAYYKAVTENKLGAIQGGLNSIDAFEECLELDKNFYESFIAIGSYKYWRSNLPLVRDEKAYAIELLTKAIDSTSYNRYLAINSLIWIYIDMKDYIAAVDIALKGLKEYPDSRYFKRGLARAYEDIDKEKAIAVYKDILNSFGDLTKMNHYNEILFKHLMAQQYAKNGNKEEALKLCNEILAIKDLNPGVKARLEKRLERVNELKQELSK